MVNMNEAPYDSFELSFESLNEFEEFFSSRAKNEDWVKVPIGGILFNVCSGGPLFDAALKASLKLESSVSDEAYNSTCLDGSAPGTVKGSEMSVRVFDNSKATDYLLSDVALASAARLLIGQTTAFSKLPVPKKAEALKTFQSVYPNPREGKQALMQFAFGKARTFHIADRGDKSYSVMRQHELLSALVEFLDKEYPGNVFKYGYYNHSYTSAMWLLPEQREELLDAYSKACKAHGIVPYKFTPAIIWETSDAGDKAVTIRACLISGNYRVDIGSPVKVEHVAGNTVSTFRNALDRIFVQFKDMVGSIPRIMDIEIEHPVGCLKAIGEQVGISPRFMDSAIEFFNMVYDDAEKVSAYDIFFTIQETLLDMQKENVAQRTIEKVRENATRCLSKSFSWKEVDHL